MAGRDHKVFIYNDAAFILVLAIADGALFGFQTLYDVRKQEAPSGRKLAHSEIQGRGSRSTPYFRSYFWIKRSLSDG
jgi:hypothetical protein